MQSTTAWFVNVVDLTSMQTQACSIITLLFTRLLLSNCNIEDKRSAYVTFICNTFSELAFVHVHTNLQHHCGSWAWAGSHLSSLTELTAAA